MAKKFNQVIRMCISCRQRDAQINLYRLRCENSQLSVFTGIGRSFYICKLCIDNERKISKALMRQCKSGDKTKFMNTLKEIITDDRKS